MKTVIPCETLTNQHPNTSRCVCYYVLPCCFEKSSMRQQVYLMLFSYLKAYVQKKSAQTVQNWLTVHIN